MKTKNNQTPIKSKLINYVSLLLIMSMLVCVGCKKEPIIVPNASPITSNEVIEETKQTSFNKNYMARKSQNRADQAATKICTPENRKWFHQLIELNPVAYIVVSGCSIVVGNPVDKPLRLPKGPVPGDVELTDNP